MITYYEMNWHPVSYDGVEGLKLQNLSFQNRTSNSLESVNQKIKTVCKKSAPLSAILNSFKFEQRQRENEIFTKRSVFKYLINLDILKYQQYLKLCTCKFLQEQLKLKEINN